MINEQNATNFQFDFSTHITPEELEAQKYWVNTGFVKEDFLRKILGDPSEGVEVFVEKEVLKVEIQNTKKII